jgi:hypothetical protein
MTRMLLWAVLMIVHGAALAQRPVPVSGSDIPLQFEHFSISPPGGGGWFMLDRSKDGVMFARRPASPGHTLMAWAVSKKIDAPVHDLATYLERVKPELERRFESGRHKILEARIARYDRLPDTCLRYWFKALDTGVQGLEGKPQNFLVSGIHCLAARDRDFSIDVNFSERGGPESWSAAMLAEADGYFATFRVETAAK